MVWGYQCYYHGGLSVPATRRSWSIYVVVSSCTYKSKQCLESPKRKELIDY